MPDFRIAAAQVPSVRGDIDRNVATHAAAIETAATHDVAVLIFPELSLSGYEPELASQLAMREDDVRLAPLTTLARRHGMAVVVGAPLRRESGHPALGAIAINRDGATRTYRKMHLGGTEPQYFSAGDSPLDLVAGGQTVGLAICADSSRPTHPQTYADRGATVYATGVFLNAEWYATDVQRLADYAARHRMLVVMANHAASIGTLTSVGKSKVWSPNGAVLVDCEGTENALLIATHTDGGWRGDKVEFSVLSSVFSRIPSP